MCRYDVVALVSLVACLAAVVLCVWITRRWPGPGG